MKKEKTQEIPQKILDDSLDYPSNQKLTMDDLPKEFDSWNKIYHWWCNGSGHFVKHSGIIYILVPILGSGRYAFNMFPLSRVIEAMHEEKAEYEKRKRNLGK